MISKTAMITICGRPNVGKSTLTNALAGEKIAIVSNKPQTTRNRITAVCQRGETQFVFLDTPGFHKPRTRLGDYMVNVVRQSVADVDAVVLVVEPVASLGPQERELIASIKAASCPAVLAINKLDTVEPEKLLAVIALYSEAYAFNAIVPISAKTGDGVEELLKELDKFAVESPALFPEGVTTDQPGKAGLRRADPRKAAAQSRTRGAARHGGGDHALFRAGRRHHRSGSDDLLRKGEPQGDHHRQARRDAQKDRRGRPQGY